MATLFASETYIKANTPIYSNVESADLLPHILNMQEIEIQKILGSELYRHLLAGIAANTLNSDETALVAIIQPCLANYTYSAALPFNWAKLTARGMQSNTADHSNAITLKEVESLANRCKNLAEYYSQRIIDYLLAPENNGKFPLYYASNARKIKPERDTTYRSPIYLGDDDKLTLRNQGWVN
jgi:hypothetical protein